MSLLWHGIHFMKNTLSAGVLTDRSFIGLLGMNPLRLKYLVHMIIVFGILLGILLAIYYAVVAMIKRQSSGVETGLVMSVVINTTSVKIKVMVIRTQILLVVLWVGLHSLSHRQLQGHLLLDYHEMKELFLALELQCLCLSSL